MSVPRTLELPAGVRSAVVAGLDGDVATLTASATGPRRGHVLLVPGWTGSKEDFTPLLPLLADAGYDVMAYDQAGQYESAPAADYSLERYAANALHLSRSASPDGSHVLGHSFGGLVAQQAALLGMADLRSLSLLCTGPGALGEDARRPLRKLVAAIGQVPLLRLHEIREQGVKRPAQITSFLAKRFTSNDPRSLRAMTQLLIDAPDVVEQVVATGLPVWVGRGADDDAWPHDVQADMARRLRTEVHVVPDSAHSPAVENPAALVDLWLPFLKEHS
ncbi:alpha/beta fold hydrolase [Aeromicrobium chenweiae]|uniref:Alpha/beta hydrolase n=1 Tax=Aeromicrobium chenweiae TaxID=2079793 RepID=A0A2S0WP90_9ACTN|nr:alpha/beta hydrolase [Aeromicrobium chenweiae]AWB93158.1 alpha/beta hydrolase [Aeromicrobium chenweiae]TGN34148.1 alpha/beta hydrolase [Aeromicrobium chenweiae]